MSKPRVGVIEYYRDKAGQWRWRFKASNGFILCDSAEGYRERRNAAYGFNRIRALLLGAYVERVKRHEL